MVVSSEDRRRARSERATEVFGEQSEVALDVLALLDYAWHDCFGVASPPEQVVEDLWVVSGGDLAQLVSAARLAVVDYRDLRMVADEVRG